MPRLPDRLMLFCGLVVLGVAPAQQARGDRAPQKAEAAVPAEGAAFFEKKIRPVLVAECYACHCSGKGKKVRGGLALDTREGTRKGGESGPVIVPGKPEESLLIKALGHRDEKLAMPPKRWNAPKRCTRRSESRNSRYDLITTGAGRTPPLFPCVLSPHGAFARR